VAAPDAMETEIPGWLPWYPDPTHKDQVGLGAQGLGIYPAQGLAEMTEREFH
jgi:hypothetical protein